MKQPSQEDLLGFVLGALDAAEQKQIQQLIDNDPFLEEQVVELKNSLLPLEAIDTPVGPPVGLARRTCEAVAIAAKHSDSFAPQVASASNFASQQDERSGLRSSWSISDLLVGCGLVLVFGAILFPALAASRYNSRVAACQKNLSDLGSAFITFSDIHEGDFPKIPAEGNMSVAGCYAPILKDVGLVTSDSTFLCAGQGSDRKATPMIPTIAMVNNSNCALQLHQFHRQMGGDYGYSLGHTENGSYLPASRMGRSHFVLLADSPSVNNSQRMSSNHSGRGQNVVFEDGRVEFINGGSIGEDAVFENNMGVVAPGADRFDSVVGPSWMRVIIFSPKVEVK